MANHNVNSARSGANHELHEQLSDLWGVIQRHPGLVAASLLITLVLGLLYYLKAPRTYESTADILIVTKRAPGLSSTSDDDRPVYEKTMETHALMVRSPLVVGRAAQDFGLLKLATLADEDDPVKAIINELIVGLKDENSSVLSVAYRSRNDEDCYKVVHAITQTYKTYLGESNQQIGKETTDLIAHANDNLLAQLRTNAEEHRKFQKNAPLMWRDGEGVNVHHERQAEIEKARQELMVERTVLGARIDALNEALATGGISRQAVYYVALNELQLDENYSEWRSVQIKEQEEYAERTAVNQYAALLVGEYVRLMVKQSEMLDEFDQGHPEVQLVTKRKQTVKEMLNGVLESQSALNATIIGRKSEEEEETDYVAIYMQLLRDKLAILEKQIAQLDSNFQAEQQLANEMQEYLLLHQAFRDDHDRTQQLFDQVKERLAEIRLIRDYGGDSMEITAMPQLGEQVAPNIIYVLLGSTVMGMMLGCCLAWMVDRSEQTFHSTVEIRHALGVPVIGRIPLMRAKDQDTSPDFPDVAPIVCNVHHEASHASEAFRGIRTNLYFSMSGVNHKVVQITSPLPGDGKSTIASNLAVAIAKSGMRVLVVDADFRRPTLSKLLGISREDTQVGLASVITDGVPTHEAAIETQIDNLYFLPSSERPCQPSELLSTPEFQQVLEAARERFDFVLVDTPPLMAVSDPCVVATLVDGLFLTLRIRKGVQMAARRSMEMLNALDANVLGVIVNGMQPKRGYEKGSYDYGYGYGYGDYGYGNAYAKDTNGYQRNGDEVAASVALRSSNGRT